MPQIKDFPIEKTTAEDNDYLVMQNPDTGETYKIKKSNLLKGLSSSTSTPTVHQLNFGFSGDSSGLFYYFGTNKGTTTWLSPAGGAVSVVASSIGYGDPSALVDRSGNKFWTSNTPNSWVSFQFPGKLNCNYYSIKSRSGDSDYYPRNWKLQGSNDGNSWDDLDVQVNNTSLSSAGQWLSLPVPGVATYSMFRVFQNGVDSTNAYFLCLDEVELYGSYSM